MKRPLAAVMLGLLLGATGRARAGAVAPDPAGPASPSRPRVAVFSMVIRALADGRAAEAFDQDIAQGHDPVLAEVPTRLRLELDAAGLLAPDDAHGADYVVCVLRERDGGPLVAELRPTRPDAPSPPLRRQPLVASVQSDAASVAAIRTVEFVRAAILQDQAALQAHAPGADAEEPTKPGHPFVVGFAVTAIQGFRGLDTALGVGGHFGFALAGPLSLRIMSSGSAFARQQPVPGGSVSITQIVAGAGLGYALGDFHGIRPALSVMSGIYLAGITAHATEGTSISSQPTTAGNGLSAFASVGLGVPLVSWGEASSLRLQVDALFARAASVVGGDRREVGRTGNPVMLIGLSTDYQGHLRLDGRR